MTDQSFGVCLATTAERPGGVWRHMCDLAAGLTASGVPVRIEVPERATDLVTDAARRGLRVNGSPFPHEVFHLHLASTYDLVATGLLLKARLAGHRTVVTEHLPRTNASDPQLASRPPRRGAAAVKSLLKRLQLILAERVIVLSSGSATFLRERYGIRPDQMVTIYNGVRPESSGTIAWASGPYPRFVATGSVIQQKGYDLLIAAGRLATKDWQVEVWGEGPHRSTLSQQGSTLRLSDGRERIAFHGWSDAVSSSVQAADALVMPSRWEALPYSALEAMALGRPVIGTAVDGLSDLVVPGVTGVLVQPNPIDLAKALDEFTRDPHEQMKMGHAGHERVTRHFSLDAMVSATRHVYTDLHNRAAGEDAVTLVGPDSGGVGHVSRQLSAAWSDTEWRVRTLLIGDDGTVTTSSCTCMTQPIPERRAIAWRAVRSAWQHRHCLRASSSLHLELGRLSVAPMWFALAAALLDPRLPIVTSAHDLPTAVLHPGAGLFRNGPGWRDAVAFRLISTVFSRPALLVLRLRSVATVVLSEAAAKSADELGWARVVQVAHGAAPPTPGAPRPSLADYILLAGYLGPAKGLDVLAAAWEQTDTSLPLVIAGDHSEQHAVWVADVRARLDRSARPPHWLGFVPDDEFNALIAHAAIVVLPYQESNPASGVLVRALVEGRAVVASRVAAVVEEVVNGVNGLLVDPGDPIGLAKAISTLVGSPHLRDRLGGAAAEHAAMQHTWTSHVAGLVGLHEEVARSRPSVAEQTRRHPA